MDVSTLADLPPEGLRALLPGFLGAQVGDAAAADRAYAVVKGEVATWGDDVCRSVARRLAEVATQVQVWEAVPDARRLARTFIGDLAPGRVEGLQHLIAAAEAGPVTIVCNHVSYVDTTVTDLLLARMGHDALADRLVAAAGPKVYTDAFRRVAAICLHTIPVPQSGSVGHAEHVSARELAAWALRALDVASEAVGEGRIVVVYAEGSRTRSGRLGSFLKGVHRWLGLRPGTHVVPAGLTGTDRLMPLGRERLFPADVGLTFGAPIAVDPVGTREALALAWHGVAALLPAVLAPDADTKPIVG